MKLDPQSTIRGVRRHGGGGARSVEVLEARRLLVASIQGSVLEDKNANGVQDADDTLPLWTPTIYADLNFNGTLDAGEPSTTQAFASSSYRLELPTGGTYLVRVILPDTYVATMPASGTRTITIQNGFTTLGNNFGGWRRGSYAAKPFDDTNGNGTRETGEFDLYRRALWADLDRDGVMDPNEPASAPVPNAQLALRPGSYSMRLDTGPGWANTTAPNGLERVIQPGIINLAEPLGQVGTLNLRGTAAQDVNGSADLDPSDAVLSGWTVFADKDKDGVRDAGEPFAVTAADGTYAIVSSALAGTFNLRIASPSGQVEPTFSAAYAGQTQNTFGNDNVLIRVSNMAQGRLFADLNGNGVWDSTSSYQERAAANQLVYADVNNNGLRDPGEATGRTDTGGTFSFAVPVGTLYPIRPDPGDDYALSPSMPAFASFTYNSSFRTQWLGSLPLADNRPTRSHANVAGAVFDDVNRNGWQDPGEASRTGQTVYIDWNANLRRDVDEPSAETGVDGRYIMTDLTQTSTGAGPIIRVETTPGWRNTQFALNDGPNVQIYAGSSAGASVGTYAVPDVGVASWEYDVNDRQAVRVTFTHELGASLQAGDFVLSVRATDGSWLPLITQFGISNVSVVDGRTVATLRLSQLIAADAQYRVTLLPQSVADAAGTKNPVAQQFDFFSLTGDANRDQTVNELDYAILLDNFGQSSRTFTQGDFNYDGTVDAADRDLLFAKFGQTVLTTPGSIAGRVFNDANGNGAFDTGEAVVSGRTVYLDVNGNGVPDANEPAKTTTSSGQYVFPNMGPGLYELRQVVPSGWRQTSPAFAGANVVALAIGQAPAAVDFGVTNQPAPPAWLAAGSAATWNPTSKTLTVTGAASITADPSADLPTINVGGAGAALTIATSAPGGVRLAGLNLSNGATARLAVGGGERTLVLGSLSVTTGGTLDLGDHAMIVRSGGVAAVQPLLASGSNHGAWNGPGITSTSAGSDPQRETALGFASNANLNRTAFAGVSGLAPSDTLVRFTYSGDANLDGQVDIGDLGLLSGSWQQPSGRSWFDGDFTFDGAVDIGDLGLLSGNWQKGVGHPL